MKTGFRLTVDSLLKFYHLTAEDYDANFLTYQAIQTFIMISCWLTSKTTRWSQDSPLSC